jgi:hypothetical protein
MAQLEGAGWFREFEADGAAETASVDHLMHLSYCLAYWDWEKKDPKCASRSSRKTLTCRPLRPAVSPVKRAKYSDPPQQVLCNFTKRLVCDLEAR